MMATKLVSPLVPRVFPSIGTIAAAPQRIYFLDGRQSKTSSFSTDTSNAAETAGASTTKPPSVELFQYAICPFCNIAKTTMAFANVSYKAVEVNPLTKAEIKWSNDYRKVPIALMDGKQLNGSDDIVKTIVQHPAVASNLQEKIHNHSMPIEEFATSEESQKWIDFARDDLATLLYPNICSTWKDSHVAFSYVHQVDNFSTLQKFAIQNLGSLAMYFAASKIKQKRNITDEREALNVLLVRLEEGLQGKLFLSGTGVPNLGDIAVYGTLRSIEGLPAHTEIFNEFPDDSSILSWYKRMESQVNN